MKKFGEEKVLRKNVRELKGQEPPKPDPLFLHAERRPRLHGPPVAAAPLQVGRKIDAALSGLAARDFVLFRFVLFCFVLGERCVSLRPNRPCSSRRRSAEKKTALLLLLLLLLLLKEGALRA